MRVNAVKINQISFGEALNSKQLAEYRNVLNRSNEVLGTTGKKVLIVHDASLPQAFNTGVGNLADKKAVAFFDLMKEYLGINMVEVLPQTEYQPYASTYVPYKNTGLSLGQHLINPELLTSKEFGSILSADEVKAIASSNGIPNKSTFINYENVIGEDSAVSKALRTAFQRFRNSDAVPDLKKELSAFQAENADWITPKVIFSKLVDENGWDWQNWSAVDRNLYAKTTKETAKRLADLTEAHKDEIDYFAFKQFMAQKHLNAGRQALNKKGIELVGDCLMGFSQDEMWAYQSAFKSGQFIGDSAWGLPAVDFKKIHNADGSLGAAGKFLQRKFSFFFKNYDGVRFDVGWAYIQPQLTENGKNVHINNAKNYIGDEIIQLIEDTAKAVKGKDFDLSKLFYETETAGNDFAAQRFGEAFKKTAADPLKKRTQIFSTMWKTDSWGSVEHYTKTLGMHEDELLIGVGNQDSIPLRALANGMCVEGRELRKEQYEQLAAYLNIEPKFLKHPIQFIKAKYAEIFTAKHQMYFFNDVLGSEQVFDNHKASAINYRIKIPENFEELYHTAIQDGYGLNPMDALQKAFVAKGYDKKHPELYKKIVEFNEILSRQGVKTREQADALSRSATNTSKNSKILAPLIIGAAVLGLGIAAIITFKGKKKAAAANQDLHSPSETLPANTTQNEKNVFSDFVK